jgi:phosphonate transport system substrate-binding protein
MELIVPAASPIQKLTDLKGRKITFIDFKSHSGYKAAAVKLMSLGLLPDQDYQYGFSTSHDESIKGVAKGDYEAAPVASNLLKRAVANGTIRDDQFRRIYASERFPPAALGYAYNLSPELAEKVRSAMLDYSFAGTSLEMLFANSGDTKFVPINYKDDFAIICSIDLALGQGIGAKAKK